MRLKKTSRILSTYTGDTSGVCSALYELGGLIVMHDPSGCNSTYSTHDEPRWYDTDSLIFISGLTEKDAIFGNDETVISDTVEAALKFHPEFIAIAGTPIPYITGCDLNAIAMEIERRCSIPTFGFETDGMHSYVKGASSAFKMYAERMCNDEIRNKDLTVNIIGLTPLDYSVNGSTESLSDAFTKRGINVNAVWAMGKGTENIKYSSRANVNVVVSSTGIGCAEYMKKRYNIPYIFGTAFGEKLTDELVERVKLCHKGNDNITIPSENICNDIIIIGESITSLSLARAIRFETGKTPMVITPVDTPSKLLGMHCVKATYEDEILPLIESSKCIIADPIYRNIVDEKKAFIDLPHEAFSGRIFRDRIPNLVKDAEGFISGFVKHSGVL